MSITRNFTLDDLYQPGGIDSLLSLHRGIVGDARMEGEGEEPKTPESDESEPNPDEPKPPQEGDLPDWARTELTRVRGEAANYRTKLREAEAALTKAKTPEEFEAATADLQKTIVDLERQIVVAQVASKHGLPAELAALLQGDDEAALDAHATSLAKFAPPAEPLEPPPPGSLGGGLNPNSEDGDLSGLSPRELARRHGRRRFN